MAYCQFIRYFDCYDDPVLYASDVITLICFTTTVVLLIYLFRINYAKSQAYITFLIWSRFFNLFFNLYNGLFLRVRVLLPLKVGICTGFLTQLFNNLGCHIGSVKISWEEMNALYLTTSNKEISIFNKTTTVFIAYGGSKIISMTICMAIIACGFPVLGFFFVKVYYEMAGVFKELIAKKKSQNFKQSYNGILLYYFFSFSIFSCLIGLPTSFILLSIVFFSDLKYFSIVFYTTNYFPSIIILSIISNDMCVFLYYKNLERIKQKNIHNVMPIKNTTKKL
uniref:7TM_GPCR_Srx domain-containing protein n=1 Tax=Rhabditophanes sp. KR3021 TaxID=114890 RepID=A0AC35TTV6_9BILA